MRVAVSTNVSAWRCRSLSCSVHRRCSEPRRGLIRGTRGLRRRRRGSLCATGAATLSRNLGAATKSRNLLCHERRLTHDWNVSLRVDTWTNRGSRSPGSSRSARGSWGSPMRRGVAPSFADRSRRVARKLVGMSVSGGRRRGVTRGGLSKGNTGAAHEWQG